LLPGVDTGQAFRTFRLREVHLLGLDIKCNQPVAEQNFSGNSSYRRSH